MREFLSSTKIIDFLNSRNNDLETPAIYSAKKLKIFLKFLKMKQTLFCQE